LNIEQTNKTPSLKLDVSRLELAGRSIPEDAVDFYSEVIEIIKKHFSKLNNDFTVDFRLDYINSASKKALIPLIKFFDNKWKEGKSISIFWYYEKLDEDMRESGEDMKAYLSLPFEIKVI